MPKSPDIDIEKASQVKVSLDNGVSDSFVTGYRTVLCIQFTACCT